MDSILYFIAQKTGISIENLIKNFNVIQLTEFAQILNADMAER